MRRLVGSFVALAVAASLLFAAPAAQASSDSAWRAFNQRVTTSCLRASGIRNARPSTIISFDDRVGKVAMLISDRSRGSARAKLCLYDTRTRQAFVDDAEMWSAPPAPR